jgi:hypothetical protein
MNPKEAEQFIPGSIDAMRRLYLAVGEAEGAMQRTVIVTAKDLRLLLSATKKISTELVRYRVTTPKEEALTSGASPHVENSGSVLI